MLSRLAIFFVVMYRIASAFTLNGRHAAHSTGSQTARALSTSLQMSDNVVEKRKSFVKQAGAAGIASAAVIAAAAVNSAVGMRQLSAPDAQKSFVYKDGGGAGRVGQVDEYGLPLVYDKVWHISPPLSMVYMFNPLSLWCCTPGPHPAVLG
jgi:hypothetical protein